MKVVGGALLVAGTTIGAAMLALPATVGVAGFFPSLMLFALCWSFMMYSAFLLVEVNHTIGGTANLITMARKTLGRTGEIAAWIFSLALLYALIAAYLSGGGAIIAGEFHLPKLISPLLLAALFGFLLFFGIRPVDYMNRFLMLGLGATFLFLIFTVLPHGEGAQLLRITPGYTLAAVPVVITSFGYHIIIPSLASYLDHDLRKVRFALIFGSLLTLVVYLAWTAAILGVVPAGDLIRALASGQPAVTLADSLERLLGNVWIGQLTMVCSLFAILTSILGVSIALTDCLADGLGIEKSRVGRLLLTSLTFVPPLLFAWLYPRGFIIALSYGGVFVSVLLGILPALMVWGERYWKKSATEYHTWGGRPALVVAILFFVGVICMQFFGVGSE